MNFELFKNKIPLCDFVNYSTIYSREDTKIYPGECVSYIPIYNKVWFYIYQLGTTYEDSGITIIADLMYNVAIEIEFLHKLRIQKVPLKQAKKMYYDFFSNKYK